MRPRSLRVLALVCVVLFPLAEASSQDWVPIIAKRSKQRFRVVSGNQILEEEVIGSFYRSSDGSTYASGTRVFSASPRQGEPPVIVKNTHTGISYVLYPTQKRGIARKCERNCEAFRQPPPSFLNQQIGEKQIEGINCVGLLVEESAAARTVVWAAPSLQWLFVEIEMRRANQLVITKLSEIKKGIEPDPRFFQTPSGYEITIQAGALKTPIPD